MTKTKRNARIGRRLLAVWGLTLLLVAAAIGYLKVAAPPDFGRRFDGGVDWQRLASVVGMKSPDRAAGDFPIADALLTNLPQSEPGSGLPIEPLAGPAAVENDPVATRRDAGEAHAVAGNPEPLRSLDDGSLPRLVPPPSTAVANAVRPAAVAVVRTVAHEEQEGAAGRSVLGDGDAQATIDLIRALGDADEAVAARAEAELRRRGFNSTHLELGRRLTDPDPRVRQGVLRVLASARGIDARAWLMWLSHDADVEVRGGAAALMVTSGEPDLLARVAEMADQDENERVRTQAREALDKTRPLRLP